MALQRKTAIVLYIDGRQERYPLRPMHEIAFEKALGVNLAGSLTATQLYQLCWEAMRADVTGKGKAVANMDEWAKTIDALDLELKDVAPLDEAAVDDYSQNSALPLESPLAS